MARGRRNQSSGKPFVADTNRPAISKRFERRCQSWCRYRKSISQGHGPTIFILHAFNLIDPYPASENKGIIFSFCRCCASSCQKPTSLDVLRPQPAVMPVYRGVAELDRRHEVESVPTHARSPIQMHVAYAAARQPSDSDRNSVPKSAHWLDTKRHVPLPYLHDAYTSIKATADSGQQHRATQIPRK